MALPAKGYRLTQISPRAYEHPADRAATAALKSIPHLDAVIRTLIDLGYERALRQAYLGAGVRLGDKQLPEMFRTHQLAYKTLDVEPVPDLYLTQWPFANAMTIGAKRPIVILQSALADLLDDSGLRVVFAHEAGHVLSDHVLYRTALQILLLVGNTLPMIASLPLAPLKAALLEWQRAGELTCDRAAALVTRDPVAVCRVLMILASGAQADRLDLDEFMRQGGEYREPGFGLGRLSRLTWTSV